MNKLLLLMKVTVECKDAGHSGFFTSVDLAFLMKTDKGSSFSKFLSKAVSAGVLIRVCRGIYINSSCLPHCRNPLFKIAVMLHNNHIMYVSAESELSYIGAISQIPINYLSMMTMGRSGVVKTTYGSIEFTHTKKKLTDIMSRTYLDPDYEILRATEELAVADLTAIGRNICMLEKRI
jgi:hypothetical protein